MFSLFTQFALSMTLQGVQRFFGIFYHLPDIVWLLLISATIIVIVLIDFTFPCLHWPKFNFKLKVENSHSMTLSHSMTIVYLSELS